MSGLSNILSRAQSVAPFASVVCLIVLSQALSTRAQLDPQTAIRMEEVHDAVESVPRLIGPWVGSDEQVSPQAQQLLRPNALLSRTYRKPGGPRVQVLLVHCSDARDMIGHYPPICYPSSGWLPEVGDDSFEDELELADGILPVQVYRFRRIRDQGSPQHIRIFSAFVLPDGTPTRLIDDINQQSQRLAVSTRGVAQLQIITPAQLPHAEARSVASEILMGMSDLFEVLRVPRTASEGR